MELSELLNGLNKEERVALYSLLKSEFQSIPQLTDIKTELNQEQVTVCPHCKSTDIYGHGVYKGRKRYMCKIALKPSMILQALLYPELKKRTNSRNILNWLLTV